MRYFRRRARNVAEETYATIDIFFSLILAFIDGVTRCGDYVTLTTVHSLYWGFVNKIQFDNFVCHKMAVSVAVLNEKIFKGTILCQNNYFKIWEIPIFSNSGFIFLKTMERTIIGLRPSTLWKRLHLSISTTSSRGLYECRFYDVIVRQKRLWKL